jgi:hypothetical protein
VVQHLCDLKVQDLNVLLLSVLLVRMENGDKLYDSFPTLGLVVALHLNWLVLQVSFVQVLDKFSPTFLLLSLSSGKFSCNLIVVLLVCCFFGF